MLDYHDIKKLTEIKIYGLHDVYTTVIYEGYNGVYDIIIYDSKCVCINPKKFIDCTTEYCRAINLTWDDVQKFLTAVKDYDAN